MKPIRLYKRHFHYGKPKSYCWLHRRIVFHPPLRHQVLILLYESLENRNLDCTNLKLVFSKDILHYQISDSNDIRMKKYLWMTVKTTGKDAIFL